MDIKKAAIAVAAMLYAAGIYAATWNHISEGNWYSGDKLAEADLAGKVVLVDEWGVNCGHCIALLPKMEELWQNNRHKPFVLIGSHRQGHAPDKVKELVEKNKLTYPVYDSVGIAGEPSNQGGIPFLYVVDAHGRVTYSGRSEPEAAAAIAKALAAIDEPPSLTPGFSFSKTSPYKALEKKLVLGKPVAATVKSLERDVKKAEGKHATEPTKAKGEEAKKILAAIESAKTVIKEDIEGLKTINPENALKCAKLYMKTFPEEGAVYKDQLEAMAAAAKEWKAAEKAKAKAKK